MRLRLLPLLSERVLTMLVLKRSVLTMSLARIHGGGEAVVRHWQNSGRITLVRKIRHGTFGPSAGGAANWQNLP